MQFTTIKEKPRKSMVLQRSILVIGFLLLLSSCAGTHVTKYMYAPYSFQNDPAVLEKGEHAESLALSNGFNDNFEPDKYAYVDVASRYGIGKKLDAAFHWGLNQRGGFYYGADTQYQLFGGESQASLSFGLSSTARLKWDVEEAALFYFPFQKDLIRVVGLHPGFQLGLGDTFIGLTQNSFFPTNKDENPYDVDNYVTLNIGHWFTWKETFAPELVLLYDNQNDFQPSIWFRIRFKAKP